MVANYVGYVVLCGISNFFVSCVYKVYICIFVYIYMYINTYYSTYGYLDDIIPVFIYLDLIINNSVLLLVSVCVIIVLLL